VRYITLACDQPNVPGCRAVLFRRSDEGRRNRAADQECRCCIDVVVVKWPKVLNARNFPGARKCPCRAGAPLKTTMRAYRPVRTRILRTVKPRRSGIQIRCSGETANILAADYGSPAPRCDLPGGRRLRRMRSRTSSAEPPGDTQGPSVICGDHVSVLASGLWQRGNGRKFGKPICACPRSCRYQQQYESSRSMRINLVEMRRVGGKVHSRFVLLNEPQARSQRTTWVSKVVSCYPDSDALRAPLPRARTLMTCQIAIERALSRSSQYARRRNSPAGCSAS